MDVISFLIGERFTSVHNVQVRSGDDNKQRKTTGVFHVFRKLYQSDMKYLVPKSCVL
jgi:hypothetical protein